MIEARLAACVNILGPCRSIFHWQGAIETASEIPALFKTASDRVDALIARVSQLHSYENPAITVWPIERLPVIYCDWVEASVRG